MLVLFTISFWEEKMKKSPKRSWDISLVQMIAIFTSPKNLEFRICRGDSSRFSLIISYGPTGKYETLFSYLAAFETEVEAAEFTEKLLKWIWGILIKEFLKPSIIFYPYVGVKKEKTKTLKVLDFSMIDKIKEELIKNGEAKTFEF